MKTQPTFRPRRRWVWWLAGIFGGSVLVLAVGVASMVMLDGDAAALRNTVAKAGGWTLKQHVQVTIGEGMLDATRFALGRWGHVKEDARAALAAVRSASVGVYDLGPDATELPAKGWNAVDEIMTRRGWTRAVAVKDARNTVVVYTDAPSADTATTRVCLAVRSDGDLVVVSAELATAGLEKLLPGRGFTAEFSKRSHRTPAVRTLSALLK